MSGTRPHIDMGTQLFGARSKGNFILGAKLAQGGEGSVYALSSHPDLLAKIYHQRMKPQQLHKLKALVEAATPELLGISAWPQDILVAGRAQAVGFLMQRVEGEPLHLFYSPKSRLQHFENLPYDKLIYIAARLAESIAIFHKAGFILGDINGSNLLVRNNLDVYVIDCDSVQIGSGKHHRCAVGQEEFLAPELQGKPLATIRRNEGHDSFALAVLIFLLLGMGRHPFSGGGQDANLGKAISSGRHVFSWQKTFPLQPLGISPHALFTLQLQGLLKQGFNKPGFLSPRPKAHQFMQLLRGYHELMRVCPANELHVYLTSEKQCPWCEIEKQGKPALFTSTRQVATTTENTLETIVSWLGVALVLLFLYFLKGCLG